MVIFVESVLSEALAVLAGKIISTCLPDAGLLLLIISNHQVILWCIKCLIGFALLSINPNGAWCHVQQEFTLILQLSQSFAHIFKHHLIGSFSLFNVMKFLVYLTSNYFCFWRPVYFQNVMFPWIYELELFNSNN